MDMPPEVRTHVLTCLQKKAKDPDVRLYKQKQKMLDVQRRKNISKWQNTTPGSPLQKICCKESERTSRTSTPTLLYPRREKLKGNWDWKLKMTDILSRRSAEAFTTTRV